VNRAFFFIPAALLAGFSLLSLLRQENAVRASRTAGEHYQSGRFGEAQRAYSSALGAASVPTPSVSTWAAVRYRQGEYGRAPRLSPPSSTS